MYQISFFTSNFYFVGSFSQIFLDEVLWRQWVFGDGLDIWVKGVSLVNISFVPVEVEAHNCRNHWTEVVHHVTNGVDVLLVSQALLLGVESDVVKIVEFQTQRDCVAHDIGWCLEHEFRSTVVVLVQARVDNVQHDWFVLALEVWVVKKVNSSHCTSHSSLVADCLKGIKLILLCYSFKVIEVILHPITHALLINWVRITQVIEPLDEPIPNRVVSLSHEYWIFKDVLRSNLTLFFIHDVVLLGWGIGPCPSILGVERSIFSSLFVVGSEQRVKNLKLVSVSEMLGCICSTQSSENWNNWLWHFLLNWNILNIKIWCSKDRGLIRYL